MKNKFTILMAIFFISSAVNFSLNAKSQSESFEDDPYECWEVADSTVDTFRTKNLQYKRIASHEEEFNVWIAAYDGCMGNAQ